MLTKRAKSRSPNRPHPSAMFVGTDAADLRIWALTPKRSSRGKALVSL